MFRQKIGPQWEYREQESRRVKDSPTVADKFRQLKSLILNLNYYDEQGVSQNSHIKYTVNLANARSVFRVNCPNNGCIRGDFDLTEELAAAVSKHQTTVNGEKCCEGWRSKTTIDTVHCHNILRYTINLAY